MKLTHAQHFALAMPVATNDDMKPQHLHAFKDVHGRNVGLSLTVSRFQSIVYGYPVWDARVNLGRNNNIYRLSKKMEPDAYAAAVFAVMGVGGEMEYYNISQNREVVSLRVPLTEDEMKMMYDGPGKPELTVDLPPQRHHPRPKEHYSRHAWMDTAESSIFKIKPDEAIKEESPIVNGD